MRAVRKNVRQMSDRQSPSHHISTSSYVGLLLILISHVSAVQFAYKSVRRRADQGLQLLITSLQSLLSGILLYLYTYCIIEQTFIAFFHSGTTILFFSYQIQHIFYHLSIILLLHMYAIRIQGMFSTFQYLIMLRLYFIMVCVGSGVLIYGFHAFSLHMLLCVSYKGSASNIHCFELQFDLYSLLLPQQRCSVVPHHHAQHHDATNILCISCVHFI